MPAFVLPRAEATKMIYVCAPENTSVQLRLLDEQLTGRWAPVWPIRVRDYSPSERARSEFADALTRHNYKPCLAMQIFGFPIAIAKAYDSVCWVSRSADALPISTPI
jgi:hypothetical protein